ncbi:MAG TPA: hypothetical protein VGO39_13460 [Gaiellaceae bacterium]|nr:hypothetical protein [Gaiellaceae bacterium]
MKLRICLIAIACAAVTAALGMSSAKAATIKSYCIDGATVSVSNDTPLGTLNQFQLDTYATLGGAYTFKIGTGADAASFLAALGTLEYVVSPFSIPGGVFHPVLSGACSAGATPPPVDPGATTTTTSSPVPDGGIFLCYSKYQVDPGVWFASQAKELLAAGYWKPVAVPGIASATRYGAFSLVCNTGKQAASVPVAAVDGTGDVYTGSSWLDRLDTYVIAP